MRKAFTLIELVVAVGILALVGSFAGVIFKISIESHRVAGAHTEIMQKLRAITDRLNADFKGLRKDTPLLIWFQQDPNDPDQRYDQIMLFADGDFQSTRLYGFDPEYGAEFKVPFFTGNPVIGNAARIYYGQANMGNLIDGFVLPEYQPERNRILARRQHILSADSDLLPFPDLTNLVNFIQDNNRFEHYSISLAEWKSISKVPLKGLLFFMCLLNDNRPQIGLHNPETLHMLMAQNVGSFSVQWAYYSEGDEEGSAFRWWPSYFHFVELELPPQFGVYFNMPGGVDPMLGWASPGDVGFLPAFFPQALKFTFTLYDSKGVIKDGRTFTHIVYLGE